MTDFEMRVLEALEGLDADLQRHNVLLEAGIRAFLALAVSAHNGVLSYEDAKEKATKRLGDALAQEPLVG